MSSPPTHTHDRNMHAHMHTCLGQLVSSAAAPVVPQGSKPRVQPGPLADEAAGDDYFDAAEHVVRERQTIALKTTTEAAGSQPDAAPQPTSSGMVCLNWQEFALATDGCG